MGTTKKIITTTLIIALIGLTGFTFNSERSTSDVLVDTIGSVVFIGDDKNKGPQSIGTGFLVGEYIITNNHVIDDKENLVIFYDKEGTRYTSVVKAKHKESDLAVLLPQDSFFRDKKRKPLELCSDIRVGEKVFTIGHPLGYRYTVTEGIVSADRRFIISSILSPLIQTDAKILPGNSGGPLITSRGCVAGINTLLINKKISEANERADGQKDNIYATFYFSIDSRFIRTHLPELIERKKISVFSLGVIFMEETKVQSVLPNSIAYNIGIQPGDVLIGINGKDVHNFYESRFEFLNIPVAEDFHITIQRGDKKFEYLLKNT